MAVATPVVKRRQQVLKPREQPRNYDCWSLRCGLSGGSIDDTVMVRVVDPAGVLDRGKGMGMDRLGTCEIPLASTREYAGKWAAG